MAKFLFQPDPIDGVEFKPIRIDIHLGTIKIVDEEIYYDFQSNNSESIIVGTDREEVIERVQRGLEYQYNAYGRINEEDIDALDHNTLQCMEKNTKTYDKTKKLTKLSNITKNL